jgi:nucleotide-binding universal stress UspA family protein
MTETDVHGADVLHPVVPRHVVVPLSAHWDAQRALPAAIWLATRAQAPVSLLTVAFDASSVESRHAELERIGDDLRARGLDVTTRVRRTEEVAAAIVEEARLRPGSVICMPSHGPGRLAELAIGTVTQDVVDHAPGPILFVGPHVETVDPPRRLVAAVDDRAPSLRAVSLVDHWARAFHLEVELVEVLGRRVATQFVPGDVVESATLQGYAQTLRAHGLEPSWDVLHGRDRSAAIADHVRGRGGSLVVVGTHARHGIPRLAQGSVAMQIVHHSPVPVVVVPVPVVVVR